MTNEAGNFESSFPIVPLTTGPKQHYFGYYDKFSENSTGRYVLSRYRYQRAPCGDA